MEANNNSRNIIAKIKAAVVQITRLLNADILINVSKKFKFLKIIHCSFLDGSCKYGDKCSYAHGDQDLRVPNGNNSMTKQNSMPPPNT